VEGRKELVSLVILLDENIIPMGYKIRINDYVSQVRADARGTEKTTEAAAAEPSPAQIKLSVAQMAPSPGPKPAAAPAPESTPPPSPESAAKPASEPKAESKPKTAAPPSEPSLDDGLDLKIPSK